MAIPVTPPTASSCPSALGGQDLMNAGPWGRWQRILVVLAGIWVGQFILFGPALTGKRVLLPLDVLALPNVYLPSVPAAGAVAVHDAVRSDLVLQFEAERRFVARELRAGRFPLWLPYQYGGVPLVWPRFSPFLLLSCATESPQILVWAQLAAATVAGLGCYGFLRRVLGLHFGPAAIMAWCYPLTGFLVLWQGFPTCGAVYWFPWLLWAVDRVARRSTPGTVVGLAVVTGLVLISGHIDVAGQALLAAGIFALWCCWDHHGCRRFSPPMRRALAALAIGWALGFALAAPHVLPLLDHARTGARMEHRQAGGEERPPVGLSALPLVVLPDAQGATRTGSWWLGAGNQIESAAAAYAGLLLTLFLAPLAWCNRGRRGFCVCWTVLGFMGLAWCLNVPGVVDLLRLPVLNMMSHNRLVFVTSFALLVQAAIGLDLLWRGGVAWRRWFWLPLVLLAGLGAWSVYRAMVLPEPVATGVATAIRNGGTAGWARTPADVGVMQGWFQRAALGSAVLAIAGAGAWWWLRAGAPGRTKVRGVLGLILVADLLWFAWDHSALADPALDFPRLPALEAIAQSPPGRILGYSCLPATLSQTHGLRDIRGYDSIDPVRWVRLLETVVDPKVFRPEYALTQWYVPRLGVDANGQIVLPGVLDMLGVRYLVFRGQPPASVRPALAGNDYWVMVNARALPRAFVPRRVVSVPHDAETLAKVGAADFDPRSIAYVETPLPLPENAQGDVTFAEESPTRFRLTAHMQTPGLVVVADRFDPGWRAYVDGSLIPILQVNYALRGVVLPAGATIVEFRYEPASFRIALALAAAATVLLLILGWIGRRAAKTADAKT